MEQEERVHPQELSHAAVIKATAALFDVSRGAGDSLQKGIKRLLASEDWAHEVEALARLGVTAHYAAGSFAENLSLPGDLALVRAEQGGVNLLRYTEGRWLYVSESGEPLGGVALESEEQHETVILQAPLARDKSGGFASLVAVWPKLRAAWAEVGIASLFANAGQLLMPIFAMLIYDKIALNGLFETLWALVFGMALYLVTDAGMRLIRSWTTERISVEQCWLNDETLWDKMVSQADLAPGGFSRFISHYRDLAQSRDFVSSSYLLQVADIPFLILYLACIGIIAWQMLLVVLALVLIYSAIGATLPVRQIRLSKEAEQHNIVKLAYMGETLNSLDVVRTSPGSTSFLRGWRELSQRATEGDTIKRLAMKYSGIFTTHMQTLTSVVVLTSGVYLIYGHVITTGKLIACNILAGRAQAQIASLFMVISKWQDFTRAAERMEASLSKVERHECTPRSEVEGHIAVIGVGKHYEGRPAALEGVSVRVEPGERIALLGKPGAGKSTLLRCLAGLSTPDVGQIQIDGLALEDISRFDRVKWLAYKGQDPVVFAGTLDENLRISGCKEQEGFAKAIWASGLENEFQSGRMSLGMQLEERGGNLSGGQRQKVALARALAQPSRILLLDEPTLGLDPEGERLLAARLPEVLEARDVLIMTTHSPIMLAMVQRIIALDGGKVVADGPRDKLVTLQPGKPRPADGAAQKG